MRNKLDAAAILCPEIDRYPGWLSFEETAYFFACIFSGARWRQDVMRTPRGKLPLPRLTAWQGKPEAVYRYSGILNMPALWTPAVLELRRRIELMSGARFNSVLLNRYRDGRDSLGWHAEGEPEPLIASLSLGATRRFEMRHNETRVTHAYYLTGGGLLVMRGRTQAEWQHRVPKEPNARGERINLTFRWVAA